MKTLSGETYNYFLYIYREKIIWEAGGVLFISIYIDEEKIILVEGGEDRFLFSCGEGWLNSFLYI